MLAAYTALALLALQVGALITGESSCNTVRSTLLGVARCVITRTQQYMCVTGLHDSDTNTDTCEPLLCRPISGTDELQILWPLPEAHPFLSPNSGIWRCEFPN